jgi:hypothetical protein
MRVSVIGGSSIDEETYATAREVGRLLGERDHTVVCGGLGGTMEAVCKGAREAGSPASDGASDEDGAETIGILPTERCGDANEWVTEQILLAREIQMATAAFGTSKWTTDKTGGTDFTKWSNYASSDPIGDLRGYKRTVRQLIGRRPNVLAMGEIVWDTLADHPDFIERIKGAASPGSPAIVTRQLVAAVLELEEIIVASAMQVTSAEGATETRADIIDDDALLLYRTPRASLKRPTAGYAFSWAALHGGGSRFIRRYREEPQRNTVIEAHSYFDFKITAADAGLFVADAVD